MVVEAFHVVVARKHREKQESGHPLQEDSPTRQHLLNVPSSQQHPRLGTHGPLGDIADPNHSRKSSAVPDKLLAALGLTAPSLKWS
jgi:hypothetical protein